MQHTSSYIMFFFSTQQSDKSPVRASAAIGAGQAISLGSEQTRRRRS
jgi:hypothetical protein